MSYCDIQQDCLWIKQLTESVEVKNQTILEQAGVILKNAKQIQELENKLDITSRQYETLQKKYTEVLGLAKQNADSYESCLQELENKLEELTKSQT